MTQEDKELLLKDLCARLHYDVMVRRYVYTTPVDSIQSVELLGLGWLEELYAEEAEFKPYLFPLSSMTKKQRDFLHKNPYGIYIQLLDNKLISASVEGFEWLNKHHFDYRNLINKNLAIDCTNLNIY